MVATLTFLGAVGTVTGSKRWFGPRRAGVVVPHLGELVRVD